MKVIIIGGIAAGMSAAAKLKRTCKDAEIIVYERSSHISFGACGLPYYVGGFFDNENQMLARTPEQVSKTGISVMIHHEVIKVDPKDQIIVVKNLESGLSFTEHYDKLMIATGASPIIPPIANVNLKNVYTLRQMADGHILRDKMKDPNIKKVGIIGAGFIGLEIVEAAKKMHKEVHVFQLEDRILKDTFDKEVTDLLEEELKREEVSLYLNTMVTGLEGSEAVTHIVTAHEKVETDLVIIATGVRPNTGFLKETGIEMLPNGAIVIDQKGKTSLPNIYAAGDCATVYHLVRKENVYIPLATSANKLGRLVGENLGGADEVFEGTLGSSCLKLMHMEAGRTGVSEQEAQKLKIDYQTVFITDKNQTDYYPGQEDISIKLIYERDSKVIIGGQVVGKKDAVQRTNVIAAAIYAKMTTKQLGMLDVCYAPPFARTWDALNVAGNVAK